LQSYSFETHAADFVSAYGALAGRV
jgi:hypothetical protein